MLIVAPGELHPVTIAMLVLAAIVYVVVIGVLRWLMEQLFRQELAPLTPEEEARYRAELAAWSGDWL